MRRHALTESTIPRTDDLPPIDGMVPESEIRWTLDPAPRPQPAPATADWPALRDFRDLVVHELVDSEALLRERVASSKPMSTSTGAALSESMALSVRLTAQLEAARREIAFQARRARTT